jgi:hypothetical protein
MITAFTLLRLKKRVFFFLTFCCLTLATRAQSSNSAINLDGVSAYAEMGPLTAPNNLSTGLTIECWVKWDAFNYWSRLVDMGNGAGTDNILLSNEDLTQNLRYEVYRSGMVQGLTSPVTMNTNQWYHIAVTHDNSGWVTMYIDGIEAVSGPMHMPDNIVRSQSYIGRSNWVADGYLSGKMDEFRIWNVARTPVEIRQHMLQPVAANANGLVAWYRFNETAGGAIINSSVNGYMGDGADAGLTRIDSPIQPSANALNMDGMDDYAAIGSPLPAGASYTKEARIYLTQSPYTPQNILSSHFSPFWIDAGTLRAGNNASIPEVTDPGVFPLLTWVHVAVTFNGATGSMQLYRDGVMVASSTSFNSYLDDNTLIGAWDNGTGTNTSFFGGIMDEVRIWNIARSASDIAANMNREVNPQAEANLVSYYTFNQGMAGGDNTGLITVMDRKGMANGTLYGMTLSGSGSNFVAQPTSLGVLPVNLYAFSVQKQAAAVRLQWTTASEQNSLDFIIEHSTDGKTWNVQGHTAAAGNSTTARNYSFIHAHPVNGLNFYRLRQRDADGKTSYSPVRSVSFEQADKSFTVQNNRITNGRVELQVTKPVVVSLYAQDGKLLWSKSLAAGSRSVSMESLAKGVYYLTGNDQAVKVVVQ